MQHAITVKRPNKWRPITGGILVFAVMFPYSIYMGDGDGSAWYALSVGRSIFVAAMSSWIIYLLYRTNTLKKDVLTGLHRRLIAEEKLEQLRLAHKDVTIGIIDVNGLRIINNTLGHEEGDKLLREVGHRLSSHFAFSKTLVARLGGDEFVVIAEHKSQQELCDEITKCLSKPHSYGDEFIAAAGVARSRSGLVRDAFKCADKAMYRAKMTSARYALQYDCVLDGIPPSTDLRPQNRLRDQKF